MANGRRLAFRPPTAPVLAAVLCGLAVALMYQPADAAATGVDGIVGLTRPELHGRWGASALPAHPPYEAEWQFERSGVIVTYRLRFDATGRVSEYYVEFDAPVALAEIPLLVPEVAFLTWPETRFTFYKFPGRNYAQDVAVFGYPEPFPPAASTTPAPRPAVMLLPEGGSGEPDMVTARLPIRVLGVALRSPDPGELVVDHP